MLATIRNNNKKDWKEKRSERKQKKVTRKEGVMEKEDKRKNQRNKEK